MITKKNRRNPNKKTRKNIFHGGNDPAYDEPSASINPPPDFNCNKYDYFLNKIPLPEKPNINDDILKCEIVLPEGCENYNLGNGGWEARERLRGDAKATIYLRNNCKFILSFCDINKMDRGNLNTTNSFYLVHNNRHRDIINYNNISICSNQELNKFKRLPQIFEQNKYTAKYILGGLAIKVKFDDLGFMGNEAVFFKEELVLNHDKSAIENYYTQQIPEKSIDYNVTEILERGLLKAFNEIEELKARIARMR